MGPRLLTFEVLYSNGLKGTWNLTCKGGGCKNKTYFCHLCACTKDTLTDFKFGDDHCERCMRMGGFKWKNSNVHPLELTAGRS
jgi:hypothetical protein